MPEEDSLQRVPTAQPPTRALSQSFDSRVTTAFCERSVSEETRRAYRRVVREFFRFTGPRHPAEVTPQDVQRWRDQLIGQKKSASTVAFKLSVVRSLFDYLQVGGYVSRNPALSKLVPPPAIPEAGADGQRGALCPERPRPGEGRGSARLRAPAADAADFDPGVGGLYLASLAGEVEPWALGHPVQSQGGQGTDTADPRRGEAGH
ncbi:MAG: hypothetical protein DMF66_14015 [Acidobacteria bacterium]|nr:MAG: hypothetical protein DMF66_14015 [Acidobacteriota bacterium]